MSSTLYTSTWTCRKSGLNIVVTKVNDDGTMVYAIRNMYRECLNHSGEWEHEPMPSNRTDAFNQRNRHTSFENAEKALTEYNDGQKFCPSCQNTKPRGHFRFLQDRQWLELNICKNCMNKRH